MNRLHKLDIHKHGVLNNISFTAIELLFENVKYEY